MEIDNFLVHFDPHHHLDVSIIVKFHFKVDLNSEVHPFDFIILTIELYLLVAIFIIPTMLDVLLLIHHCLVLSITYLHQLIHLDPDRTHDCLCQTYQLFVLSHQHLYYRLQTEDDL